MCFSIEGGQYCLGPARKKTIFGGVTGLCRLYELLQQVEQTDTQLVQGLQMCSVSRVERWLAKDARMLIVGRCQSALFPSVSKCHLAGHIHAMRLNGQ